MNVTVAVVEDIGEWAEKIKLETKKILKEEKEEIEIYASAKEFLVAEKEYDIILMDICLKDENGLKAAWEYKQRFPECIVMIVTSHKEFYKEGFKVEAFRYIEKDNLKEELKEGLEHALIKIKRFKTIDIDILDRGTVRLRYRDIIYIESLKKERKVVFYTEKGNYKTNEKITKLTELLQEDGFYHCNKSFLVNLDWVDKAVFDKVGKERKILLKTGDTIPLGAKKKKELLENLTKWRLKLLNR